MQLTGTCIVMLNNFTSEVFKSTNESLGEFNTVKYFTSWRASIFGECEVGQEMMIPTMMVLQTRTSAGPLIALLAIRVTTDLLGSPLTARERNHVGSID